MKCNKCGSEWKTDASRSSSIKVCPFCQEKIEAEKSGDWKYFDNTKDLLAHIAAEYGLDALFSKKYLSDHASPMLPPGQKKLVSETFSCGAVKILQDNVNSDQAHKEIAVKQAVKKLTDLMFSQESAERVIWEFTNAIGWGMSEPQDPNQQKGSATPQPPVRAVPPSQPPPATGTDALMTRAWLFAEDGDWKEAADYFNKVLDIAPTYAYAYLGLLCVDLKASKEDNLLNVKDPGSITNHKYYKRAIADTAIKTQLEGYVQIIKDRIDAEQKAAAAEAERKRKAAEEAARRKRVQDAFDNASKIMNSAQSPDDYRKAITAFGSIDSNYQDISGQIKWAITECERKKTDAEEAARRKPVQDAFDNALKIMNSAQNPDDYRKAITAFGNIDSNYQDISNQIIGMVARCERLKTYAEEALRKKRVQVAFDNACKIMNNAQSQDDYRKAITAFGSIDSNYQDIIGQIKSKVAECERKIQLMADEIDKALASLREKFDPKTKQEQRKADKERIDAENAKTKADVEAKCSQIRQKFDADHKAWQEEYNRLKTPFDTEYKKWENETKAIKAQAEQWKSQGLCPHCSGMLKGLLLIKKCTECGKSPREPIKTPPAPTQPNYSPEPKMPQIPTFTPRILDESKYAHEDSNSITNQRITISGIEWRILDKQGSKLLLISDKILEKRPYNAEKEDITWEKCTLRKYLNSEFINNLGAAKLAINETRNSNPNNPWHGTTGGNATTEKVFLLSLDEVCRYFGNSTANLRKDNPGTDYYIDDKNNNARIANYRSECGTCWWLRSPGSPSVRAANVGADGRVGVVGSAVSTNDGGVRPALWLNL